MDERERKEADEREQERERNMRREMELKRERLVGERDEDGREEGVSPPPSKRPHSSEERGEERQGGLVQGITGLTLPQGVSLPGTNIKITSRGQSRPLPACRPSHANSRGNRSPTTLPTAVADSTNHQLGKRPIQGLMNSQQWKRSCPALLDFTSFSYTKSNLSRRRRRQLPVREYGPERADLPGNPLPEGRTVLGSSTASSSLVTSSTFQ